jgi:hypothetical protein
MWGKNDTFGRWLQFICALLLIPFGAVIEYYWWTQPSPSSVHRVFAAGGFGCLYLGLRCLWYAITGKDNINRDELNSGNFE